MTGPPGPYGPPPGPAPGPYGPPPGPYGQPAPYDGHPAPYGQPGPYPPYPYGYQPMLPAPLHFGTKILIVLSTLFAAFGALSMLAGAVVAAAGGGSKQIPGVDWVIDSVLAFVLGALMLALGLVGRWLGRTVRRGVHWARVILTIMLALGALSAVADLVADLDSPASALLGMAINLGLIAVLWVRSSNDYFRAYDR